MGDRIGEVIEASTAAFIAQSYELHGGPDFGALVKALDGETETFALVYEVRTASIDPGRRTIMRGGNGVYDAAIYEEHPELRETLRTEFSAVIVGYGQGEGLWQRLPARPPPLHYSVYGCDDRETVAFHERLDHLPILLNGGAYPFDELVAASLRRASAARGEDQQFLLRAGRMLAMLLKDDYVRLDMILRRLQR